LAPAAAQAQNVATALSQISANADYMSQNYHEADGYNPYTGLKVWDRELGTIPGASVDIGYLASPLTGVTNLYLGGSFQYNDGNVSYHGTSISGVYRINSTTGTRIDNGFVEVGKGFYIGSQDFMLVPTLFWGQRDWRRTLPSYWEDYRTERLGAAVRGALGLTDRLTLTGRAGVAATLYPDMQASIEVPGLKFRQGGDPVYEAEAGLDYLVVGNWHVRSTADISAFDYGQSNANDGFEEPSSSTVDISVKVGIGYSF